MSTGFDVLEVTRTDFHPLRQLFLRQSLVQTRIAQVVW